MSVQRRFDRQYAKWIAKAVASGADKRWPPTMVLALAEAEKLKKRG